MHLGFRKRLNRKLGMEMKGKGKLEYVLYLRHDLCSLDSMSILANSHSRNVRRV